MQEWLNWTVSKTVVRATAPWVRIPLSPPCGAVAQMGERIPRTDEVTGSNPVCSMAGEMREWLNRHDWKSCVRESVPWVRIPLSPPFL